MKLGLLVLILLIVSPALGETFTSRIGLMLRMHWTNKESSPEGAIIDLEEFAYGVMKGIAAAEKWDQAKHCISRDSATAKLLDQAYGNISLHKPEHVKVGLHDLGVALETIPQALKNCAVFFEDIDGLVTAIRAFESPISFYYRIGISLLINGREIYHDIDSAIAAYKAHNWTAFGFYIGEAITLLMLKGDSPLISERIANYINTKATWKAFVPPMFESLSEKEIQSWFVEVPKNVETQKVIEYDYRGLDEELPTEFNSLFVLSLPLPKERIIVRNPESMQYLIKYYGLVEAHMKIYEDFLYYQDGIYHHVWGKYLGTHAVRVLGWGEENGVKYWIVDNSWGPYWGKNGLAWVAFDECGIDSFAATGFLLDFLD